MRMAADAVSQTSFFLSFQSSASVISWPPSPPSSPNTRLIFRTMSRVALSALLAVAAVAVAQDPTGTEPLADKRFTYPTGIVSNRLCYSPDFGGGARGRAGCGVLARQPGDWSPHGIAKACRETIAVV